jgi:hypothetical protein
LDSLKKNDLTPKIVLVFVLFVLYYYIMDNKTTSHTLTGGQAMNTQTHDQIVSQLPEMSAEVYKWLNEDGLFYYDPGFSDIGVEEIASGVGYTVNQVKGCVSHLVKVGLAFTSEIECNGDYYDIVDTYLHNEEIVD